MSTERGRSSVRSGGAEIDTYVDGVGPAIVILPSYGRDGGADYEDIVGRLADEGWRVLRPQPRGVAKSRGAMTGVTLHDLADDIAAVIRDLGNGRAVLIGHAFGHALASMVATDYPDLVAAVVLAASQGSKIPADIAKAPFVAGNLNVPEAERLAVLRKAFFAPGHDARIWLAGWYPETLKMEHEAASAVPRSAYRACGTVPVLEIFGACDPFKPPASRNELITALGPRVTSVMIDDASHALFPEQPQRVADVILCWVARFAGMSTLSQSPDGRRRHV